MARAGQRKPERAHPRKSAALLAHDAGDRARDLDVLRRQVDVERDQGTSCADDDAACAFIELRRTKVGRQLTGVDPPLQFVGTAAPEERRPPPGRELSVEEDR